MSNHIVSQTGDDTLRQSKQADGMLAEAMVLSCRKALQPTLLLKDTVNTFGVIVR
jgi:hypothetical protein